MRTAWVILVPLLLVGCESAPPPAAARGPAPESPLLAYVNGKPITTDDLVPPLLDASGREVFNELVLDRALAQRLAAAALTVTDDDLTAERRRMLTMLAADPDDAARVLAELRQRRGLGDARFGGLLWRNAALRKLVADGVTVTTAGIEQAYQLAHGPRYRARVIVAPTLDQAAQLRSLADEQPFTQLAFDHSTDASAPAGGLLPPVSPADESFPRAVRQALGSLQVGQVSEPIAVDDGFAILLLEATIPADGVPLEAVRDELAERVRLRSERLLMDELARELIDRAEVVILDADLSRVWRADGADN